MARRHERINEITIDLLHVFNNDVIVVEIVDVHVALHGSSYHLDETFEEVKLLGIVRIVVHDEESHRRSVEVVFE